MTKSVYSAAAISRSELAVCAAACAADRAAKDNKSGSMRRARDSLSVSTADLSSLIVLVALKLSASGNTFQT